jgi:hypothetical protein
VSVTFRGLTFGSTATGFVVPTLAQWRGAFADYARELSGYFNLQTQPGSLYGIFIDLISAGVDNAGGNAFDVVGRTIFTAMQGVALDQFIADYMRRVVETTSTATVYVYGAPGSVVPAATAVRTSQVGVPFAFLGAVNLPAAPSVAYGIEVLNFAAGAQSGQLFKVVVDGTDADYVANNLDTGATVTAGLVASVNALLQTQTAFAGGVNPNNSRPTLIVTDLTGGGVFPLSVSGPVGTITAYVASSGATDTGAVLGPTYAPAQSLRYGEPVAGVQGYTNIVAAVPGRVRETDSQLRARYQVAQRGRGGASPDAITAIILSPVEVGGGGATFCSTEYNPTDDVDAANNLPHSVRIVIGEADDGAAAALALWHAKCGGDNTNGPELYNVPDGGTPPATQPILIDRLTDLWIAADIQVTVGPDWPNVGNPLTQLRQDVVDYINALQPSTIGVRVVDLPISLFPNGVPRGVVTFLVRLGQSFVQGGPYIFQDYYPVPEPDAFLASISMSNRQKAKSQILDVTAVIV